MTTLRTYLRIVTKLFFAPVNLLAFFLATSITNSQVYATEVWGSHAYCWANKTVFKEIYKTYGGTDWYPVTIMLGVEDLVKGKANLQTLYDNAKIAGSSNGGKGIYPILRLTSQGGANAWSKIEPVRAAEILRSVAPTGFPGKIYVSFGNETHMPNEWGGIPGTSEDYWNAFKVFSNEMQKPGGQNYIIGHAGVNLSYPSQDTAEYFYNVGRDLGYGSLSKVLFSNPYDLTYGGVSISFNGTRCGGSQPLNILNHTNIDRCYDSGIGGKTNPNVFMEFGAWPELRITPDPGNSSAPSRMKFLEDAYRLYPGGVFSGMSPLPQHITPMLMEGSMKYIVVFKEGGGVAYIECGGSSYCGSEICNGGLASIEPPPDLKKYALGGGNPSGADELPPDCTPNESSITIKGTLKTTRLLTQDPMNPSGFIRVSSQSSDNPDPRSYPVTTNQKVAGAVVALYTSHKVETPPHVPPRMNVLNSTGTKDGNIQGLITQVRTKADGMFEIKSSVSCSEAWDGAHDGWKQYLAILCPDNPDGKGNRLVLKDLYSYHLRDNSPDVTLDLRDINIDCDADTSPYGFFSAPPDLTYVVRNREQFLACSGGFGPNDAKLGDNLVSNSSDRAGDIVAQAKGDWGPTPKASDSGTNLWDRIKQVLIGVLRSLFEAANLEETVPFTGRLEGREATQRVMEDYRYKYGSMPAFYRGFHEGYMAISNYYLNNAPSGVETYNGKEEKIKSYKCEMLRRSALAIGEEGYEDFNTQNSGGFINNLNPPLGGLIKRVVGGITEIDPYLSGDVAKYLSVNKNISPEFGLLVCTDEVGKGHYMGEFMPPPGYCGDIDEDGVIDEPFEMPCPQTFFCGDEDGDGVVGVGEVECSAVPVQSVSNPANWDNHLRERGMPYNFDIRYFPYFALDSMFTTWVNYAKNLKTFENMDAMSDWCGSGLNGTDGVWRKDADSTGLSRPNTREECHGLVRNGEADSSWRYLLQALVKYPSMATGIGAFTTINTLASDKVSVRQPAAMVVSSPQAFDATDSRELVLKSVEGAVSDVKIEDKAGLTKIGIVEQLCTCSFVENGNNASGENLGNCFHDPQNPADRTAPDPKEPLNAFNSTLDYKLGSETGTYENMSGKPSLVAASWDFPQTREGILTGELGSGQGKYDETTKENLHYEQPNAKGVIEMFDAARHAITNIVSCALNKDSYNDVTKDGTGSAVCGEEVNLVLRPSVWDQYRPKSDYTKTFLVNGGILDEPFRPLPGEFDVELLDTSSTKPLEFDDVLNDTWHGKGKESPRKDATNNSMTYLTNAVKPPTFEGEYSACRMVPGWQVKEIPEGIMFSVDCLKTGASCWSVGASPDATNISANAKTVSYSSSNGGVSWQKDALNGGLFIHGVSAYDTLNIASGQGGAVYNYNGSSWIARRGLLNTHKPRSGTNSLVYNTYTYDAAGTPLGGYLVTATGYLFYSDDGVSNWHDIYRLDNFSGEGCESRDFPYGCTNVDEDRNNDGVLDCTLDPEGCCCVGFSTDPTVDADGNPLTPNCPIGAQNAGPSKWATDACWLWGNSDINGVDCNESTGDCFVVGQKTAKAWYGKNTGLGSLGSFGSWTKRPLGLSGVFAMNVSFPSDGAVYVVGGTQNDPHRSSGGYVLKSGDLGVHWDNVLSDAGAGFFGIDCFSPNDCAVAGSNGAVYITEDGGAHWKDWADPSFPWAGDDVITQAKDPNSHVHFWDIAYPNKNTIIAVGYKGTGSPGVIYALGEREDCGEVGPACSGPAPSCGSGYTIDWTNDRSIGCGVTAGDPTFGVSNLTHITGVIYTGDPVTYGPTKPSFVANICNKAAGRHFPSAGLLGMPILEINYNGTKSVYKFDKAYLDTCDALVLKINLDLYIPTGSTYNIIVTDNTGTGGPYNCNEVYPFIGKIESGPITASTGVQCLNGYAWSQIANAQKPATECGWTDPTGCNYPRSTVCKSRGVNYCGGLDQSGACYACRKGLPIGFYPCSP